MDAGGRVLHRDGLRPGGLLVDLDAAEARQNVRDLAVDEVVAIQLRCDLDREPKTGPGLLHGCGLGYGPQEVAAQSQESRHLALDDALARLDRVHAGPTRRLEAVELVEPVERHEVRLLGDADRALALHVRVPPHGADPGARPADI